MLRSWVIVIRSVREHRQVHQSSNEKKKARRKLLRKRQPSHVFFLNTSRYEEKYKQDSMLKSLYISNSVIVDVDGIGCGADAGTGAGDVDGIGDVGNCSGCAV